MPDFGWISPRGAIAKSLIILNLQVTLNQRVPGSSPGAPTTQKPLFFNRLRERSQRNKTSLVRRFLWSYVARRATS